MNFYLFHHAEWERVYNCASYSVDQVPMEQRQQFWLGSITIVMFVVMETVYIPCMVAIGRHLKESSCYKLMFALGLVDIYALFFAGLITGVLSLQGGVFCTAPHFNYLTGLAAHFAWFFETATSLVLALNRCIDVLNPELSEKLFKGNRTWFWILGVFCYAFTVDFFLLPVLFTSIFYAWFFDPFVGYRTETFVEGQSTLLGHSLHNVMFLSIMMVAYTGFIVGMFVRYNYDGMSHINAVQKSAFVQVLIISLLNIFCATDYVFMQFFSFTPTLIIAAEYSWFFIHGIPPMIYLTMNVTIRDECQQIVFGKKAKVIHIQLTQLVAHLRSSRNTGPMRNGIAQNTTNAVVVAPTSRGLIPIG